LFQTSRIGLLKSRIFVIDRLLLLSLLLAGLGLGCGPTETPAPPSMTKDVKDAVKAEDAAIDAAESGNVEPQ
jgi:hypothetical protein